MQGKAWEQKCYIFIPSFSIAPEAPLRGPDDTVTGILLGPWHLRIAAHRLMWHLPHQLLSLHQRGLESFSDDQTIRTSQPAPDPTAYPTKILKIIRKLYIYTMELRITWGQPKLILISIASFYTYVGAKGQLISVVSKVILMIRVWSSDPYWRTLIGGGEEAKAPQNASLESQSQLSSQ